MREVVASKTDNVLGVAVGNADEPGVIREIALVS
jgi:hypothetical protein